MNIDNMTYGELKKIAAMFGGSKVEPTAPLSVIGKYCIVRCQKAGVHAGIVERADRDWVVLRNSRRMWKWFSGFTLSEAANDGIDANKSRIAAPVAELAIPYDDVAEIVPCSDAARKTIEGAENG